MLPRLGIPRYIYCCVLATALAGCSWIVPAWADNAPAPPPAIPRDALMRLGRDFADKIGGGFKEADLYLSGAGKLELAEHKSRTELPDNEPLLLHAIVGKNHVNLSQDIYTIKRGKRLMISLGDFASAADLAITVDPAKGAAEGWFIRQANTFALDVGKHAAVISGTAITFAPEDVDANGNDILVSAELLEKWLGLSFDYNFADLTLIVKTAQPLPVEEAYERSLFKGSRMYTEKPATLPRYATPYSMFSEPYVDANIGANWARSPGATPIEHNDWSAIFSGDLLGQNAQAFTSGTTDKPYLNALRVTLGKEDIDAGLLGPLHATSYQFGDVNTVSLPIIGSGAQEQGVAVTNRPLYTTTQTSTQLRGDAPPGWDVELYRNEVRIDIRHVETDGKYDFGNVDLIVGDNDFKFIFYGPRGEIREEHRHIGVQPAQLAGQEGHYAFSASRTGLTTWEQNKSTTPGTGDPDVAASYEQGIGALGTANAGIRSRNDLGVQRTFAEAGLASYFMETFLNADLGYDASSGAHTEILSLRRNFGKQAALLQYTRDSEDYNPSTPFSGAPTKDALRGNLSGPLAAKLLFFDHLNYNFGTTYSDLWAGGNEIGTNYSLTSRAGNIFVTGSMNYNRNTDAAGVSTDTSQADISGRGFLKGGIWRLETKYDLKPVTQLAENDVEYDHAIGETVDATGLIRYTPNPSVTDASLSLNWHTSKATISPKVEADTAHNLRLGVNVHFGAGADPFSHEYSVYNSYMSSTGGVAARIFFDKNGNGIFDNGDVLMPEVEIRALQAHRSALSNAEGIAFIQDLEKNYPTDIVIDAATFKDAGDISTFEGVSLVPHPGGVTQLDFPVVTSSEMDGQADVIDAEGSRAPARNLKLALVAPDGSIEKSVTAAYDGYWSISSIKPGVYYLVATPTSSQSGYIPPRRLVFGPEGATLYGQALVLTGGRNVAFRFRSVNASPVGTRGTRVIRPSDIAAQETLIDLGHFHSRLALTFAWYEFRLKSGWSGLFDPVTPVAQIAPDARTAEMALMLRPKQAFSLEQAGFACNRLDDLGFNCSVETVTRYRDDIPAPADTRRVSATY